MMKHLLFLFMSTLFVPVLAQQYHPILEDGKSWHYTNYDNMGENPYEYSYALHGDTVIDGQRYAAYRNERGNASSLFREEGGKVYVYSLYYKKERLLYDFTLSEGDLFNSDGNGNGLLVASVDTVRVFGSPRKCLHLCLKWQYGNGMEGIDYDNPVVWVEGMGSDRGLLNTYPIAPNDYEYLNYIEMPDGRKYDFTQSDDTGMVSEDCYHPFVSESNVWYLQSDNSEEKNGVTTYFFQGDTIINEDKCLRMYYKDSKEGIQKPLGYWTEKNHQVYYYQRSSSSPELFYDFSLESNEQIIIRGCSVRVISVDTINIRGNLYRCLYIDYSSKNGGSTHYEDIWIEGIGSVYTFQPFYQLMAGMGYRLLSYTLDGNVAVTRDDYNQIVTQISSTKRIIEINQAIYDLQGRRVTTPQKNGLYIKNGKKFVDH